MLSALSANNAYHQISLVYKQTAQHDNDLTS